MRRSVCVLSLVLVILGAVAIRADEIDDYVKLQMSALHIPAVSLAVIKSGAVVKAEGYGLADIEHTTPAKAETVFKIGSVSKQFIAAGAMLLVQDGKIGLDVKVSEYLNGLPAAWDPITIRHLLTHTSGLVREGPAFDPYKTQPDIDIISSAYALPLRFQPGEKWEYCNLGYYVLAEVIRRVSGKPWNEFLAERIFTPLGMSSTRVTSVADIVYNRASGYSWSTDKFQNMEDWPAIRPSGAFLSTALDLAKWEAALLSDRVLTQSSKTAMWTNVALNDGRTYPYGFGWQLDSFPLGAPPERAVPMIRHGGSLPGFRAGYFRWPNQALAVLVLTNLENAPLEGLAANIAIRYSPELKSALTASAPASK